MLAYRCSEAELSVSIRVYKWGLRYGAIPCVERCGKGWYVHLIIGVHVVLLYLQNQLIGKYIKKVNITLIQFSELLFLFHGGHVCTTGKEVLCTYDW